MSIRKKLLLIFTSYITMIPPIGTDLYMPALPSMVKGLGVSDDIGTLSMTLFLIALAFGMLVLGTLSDKFGRRRMLVIAALVAFVSSIACTMTPNAAFLLCSRTVQGLACGGMVSIATAIIGDSFDGKARATALSISQAAAFIGPIVAPLIGVAIFSIGGWRAEFATLTILMGLALLGTFFVEETVSEEARAGMNLLDPFRALISLFKESKFVKLMALGGPINAPYNAYLGVASFIYINYFGETEFAFSIFFAIASLAAVVGPLSFMKFSGNRSMSLTVLVLLIVCLAFAVLLLMFGSMSAFFFLICMLPFIFTATYMRPMISNEILQQFSNRTGAASSAMNFTFTGVGCIGMFVITLGWQNYIFGIGIIMVVCIGICILIDLFGFKLYRRE